MPKINEIFSLGKTQHELDFVNINPNRDTPVYLNPFTFSSRNDRFSIDASRIVEGFFQHNLSLIQNGRADDARANFSHLNEPNETCFGLSRRRPHGRGVGEENADDLFESILQSRAVASGLVQHLEDTAIFIPGIGRDKVSDMTTNIIRLNLVEYTQRQCDLLGIPLTPDVPSGFFWDATNRRWSEMHTRMLIINDKRILLVPKAVVSYVKEFDYGKYHQHYALEFLQEDHLQRNTSLVHVTRNKKDGSIKRRYVVKTEVAEQDLPLDKERLLEFTRSHPEIFADFRSGTADEIFAMPDSELEQIDINELIDHLIAQLRAIPSGAADAGRYHSLMLGILELIFYPDLINPRKEREINEGRKRIDISFDNGAPSDGFFYRLQNAFNLPCPYIFVECKNYSNDIENPELDQMVGRLSPNRGKFGIIVCRALRDEALFLRRCADSYRDQHGLIISLTDDDIIAMLNARRTNPPHPADQILSDKTRAVTG